MVRWLVAAALSWLSLAGRVASNEHGDTQIAVHPTPVPARSLDNLPPLVVDRIHAFLPTARDQARFGLSARRYLPASLDPRSRTRQALRSHCGDSVADVWLEHYFDSGSRKEMNLDSADRRFRLAFFQSACLDALARFCQAEQSYLGARALSRPPIQFRFETIRDREWTLLRKHYHKCPSEFQLSTRARQRAAIASWEAMLTDRKIQDTFTFRLNIAREWSEEEPLLRSVTRALLQPHVRSIYALHMRTLYSLGTEDALFSEFLKAVYENGHVRVLSLTHSANSQEDRMAHASRLRSLAKALIRNIPLERLELSGWDLCCDRSEAVTAFLRGISANSHLRSLLVAKSHLCLHNLHIPLRQAFGAFRNGPFKGGLLEVSLSQNTMDVHTGELLGRALSESTRLRRITLDLDPANHHNDWLTNVFHNMRSFHTVRGLHIHYRSMHMDTVVALGDMLIQNDGLEELSLVGVESGVSLHPVAQAMIHNLDLRTLNLFGSHVDDKTAKTLGIALRSTTSLTTLTLVNTGLSMRGLTWITQALEHNLTLQELLLGNNHLGEYKQPSQVALASLLFKNQSLRTLNLGFNQFTNADLAAFLHALAQNPYSQLHTLNLAANQIGTDYGHSRSYFWPQRTHSRRNMQAALAQLPPRLRVVNLHGNGFHVSSANALAHDLCRSHGRFFRLQFGREPMLKTDEQEQMRVQMAKVLQDCKSAIRIVAG